MVFSSLTFLFLYLPLTLLVYFLSPLRWRNFVLLVVSLLFYGWGEPVYIVIMFLSIIIDYTHGLLVEKFRSDDKKARWFVAQSVIFNLALLGFFKYWDFIAANLSLIPGIDLPQLGIPLPIGISFYTFQALSYTVDVWRGDVPAQRSFAKFLLYISLFPQLIAGPIVRYADVAGQIDARSFDAADAFYGATRFCIGLAKKVLLADAAGKVAAQILDGSAASATTAAAWLGIVLYTFEIYFDFSGYSDMAIGMGWMLGFHFDENFRYPFVSRSIAEFWQRWHISLGTFFRDYLLYVPIFGKRRKYVSLFLVWFCTGFWHGASWNYILWGLYFGLFIFIETLVGKKRMKRIPAPLAHLYALLVIVVGFGIFKFENLTDLGLFFKGLVGANGNPFLDPVSETAILQNLFLILGAALLSMPILPAIKKFVAKTTTRTAVAGAVTMVTNVGLVISSIMLIDTMNNPFLYFRF